MHRVKVFISYAHADRPYANRLREHLASLKREELIEDWIDHEILPGQDWNVEIQSKLDEADIIIPMISSAFIASDYAFEKELSHAMKRHDLKQALVLPVIVRRCEWRNLPIGKLEVLPTDAKPIKEWRDKDIAMAVIVDWIRRSAIPIRISRLRLIRLLSTVASIRGIGKVRSLYRTARVCIGDVASPSGRAADRGLGLGSSLSQGVRVMCLSDLALGRTVGLS